MTSTAPNSHRSRFFRNGVFYDRAGGDWDATITKVIDHPISIRDGT